MTICAPGCTCWMETGSCARHGVEPRDYHECADGTPLRAGRTEDCLLCSMARTDAAISAAKKRETNG